VEPLPLPHTPHLARAQAINGRDAGLALVRRLNGWLATAAVAGAGALSLIAAQTFHGHQVVAGRQTTSGAGGAALSRGSNASGGASVPQPAPSPAGALQPPAQAPVQTSPAPTAVVSGGS
jgi:hypothetical protein